MIEWKMESLLSQTCICPKDEQNVVRDSYDVRINNFVPKEKIKQMLRAQKHVILYSFFYPCIKYENNLQAS